MIKKILFFGSASVSLLILAPIYLAEVSSSNISIQNCELYNFERIINEIDSENLEKKILTESNKNEFAQIFQSPFSIETESDDKLEEQPKPAACCMTRKKRGGRWKKTSYTFQECKTRNRSMDGDNLTEKRGLIYWNQSCLK